MSEHWEHYNNTKKPIIQIIMHANKNSGIAPKHEVNIIGFPKDFLSRDEFSLDKILGSCQISGHIKVNQKSRYLCTLNINYLQQMYYVCLFTIILK